MLMLGMLGIVVAFAGAGCSSGRIGRVERSVASQYEYTKELMSVADANSKTINESAVRITELENRLAQVQAEMRAHETDGNATLAELKESVSFLNDQLARIDKSVQTGRPGTSTAPSSQGTGAFRPGGFNVNAAYNAAVADYQAKRYEPAISAFKEIQTVAPASTLADNAQYWIGESYYAMGNYEQALAALARVSEYPESNKAADALVKSAIINQRLGRTDQARDQFRTVGTRFPGTEAARLASKHLSALGQ